MKLNATLLKSTVVAALGAHIVRAQVRRDGVVRIDLDRGLEVRDGAIVIMLVVIGDGAIVIGE